LLLLLLLLPPPPPPQMPRELWPGVGEPYRLLTPSLCLPLLVHCLTLLLLPLLSLHPPLPQTHTDAP
jgi:hypothetical protein